MSNVPQEPSGQSAKPVSGPVHAGIKWVIALVVVLLVVMVILWAVVQRIHAGFPGGRPQVTSKSQAQ